MSDWETYTGVDGSSAVDKTNDNVVDDWDPNGGGDSDDWNPDGGNSSNDDWNPDGATNSAKEDWNPDSGNDSDDWNPDGDNGSNQDDEMDDWNPDGGGAERSENDNISSPDIKQNDDDGGFWGDYFGDSESAAGIKHDEDANNESRGANDEQSTSSNLFVKEEHDNSQWSESNHDQGVTDFYNEASKRKHPIAPSSPQSSHYSSQASVSQQSHTFSQHSNLSAAELSRMEEDLLSETSHREEEMKRQTVKEERRERRRRGESKKRPRAQMTEEQKEYKEAYYRMMYRKKLELSDETDIGGSYAFLSRMKLEEENEQKRLKGLAWERERLTRTEIHKTEDIDDAASKNSKSSKALKSKWCADGYASLPHSEAKDLPFYIYTNKRPRSCSNSQLEDDYSDTSLGSNEDSIDDVVTDSKKNTKKTRPLIEDNGVQIEGMDIVSKYTPTNSRKWVKKATITGSFPLRQNRKTPKAGTCLGSEQMIFTQGKNAKRLFARLIASNGSNTNYSSNQLIKLTKQIQQFPSTSQRQQFISSLSYELGRNRDLWEENLREWVERNGSFSEEKQIAIKYLLGIDEDITSGTHDAILSTYPTQFVSASRRLRQQLLTRFRKWLQQRKVNPDFKSEDVVESDEEIFDPMAVNSVDEERDFNVEDVNIVFTSKIDTFGTAATLSYFIDQLCLAKKKYDNLEQTEETSNSCLVAEQGIQKWQKIISTYLSNVTLDSKLSIACFEKAERTRYALPLFNAISAHQSYFANGSCLGLISRKESDNESDSDDDEKKPSHTQMMSRDELKENELLQIDNAGNEIFKYTRSHINNENLAVFLPIRLTIGISVLTEFLPPVATEILSRQTYSEMNSNQSPFDLLRLVLEQLEERGKLVSTGSFSRDKSERPIVDESLTDAMKVAADIFQQCKGIEPSNLQYWSWYIATLFARLCVASGTSLSAKIEVKRRQLHCFDEARKEASCAVDEFIQRVKSEDCPMFYFGVTSMLEWRRGIILLHRHALFSTVNRLHAYTSYRWASRICSDLSLARVQSLFAKQKLPLDALLDVLAGRVERNACNVSNWGMLVTALGGVGTPMETNGECPDGCDALHDGFCLNHTIEQDKRNGVWWWGQSRRSNWETNFFISPRNDQGTSLNYIRMDLDGKVSSEWKGSDQRQITVNSNMLHQEISLPNDVQDCMDWLFDEEEGDNDIDIDLSYEHLLPDHNPSDTHTLENQQDSLTKITNKSMKVLCLKIIVACHMLGVWHPFVSNSIWWLIVKCHASSQSASESLRWLAIRGLNIQSYIQKRCLQN